MGRLDRWSCRCRKWLSTITRRQSPDETYLIPIVVGRLGMSIFLCVASTTTLSQTLPTSDPVAITLAQQAIAAVTGGVSIVDVTLNANVTYILGSDYESGTGLLRAKGLRDSRVDLTLPTETFSVARWVSNNTSMGAWSMNGATATSEATHNIVTDAAWFFPIIGSISQIADPSVVFKYIGLEIHQGVNSQHIQVYRSSGSSSVPYVQQLSTMDFYLDPVTFLPAAVDFMSHPDNDMNRNIPVEILFANYQSSNGLKIPFHFQKLLNGNVLLDVNVTNAAFNTGLQDGVFVLP